MTFRFAPLTSHRVLRIAGPEARAFLQGLISSDMEQVSPGRAIYAALLSPQGKILWDLFVTCDGDGFLLDVEAARAEELVRRLKLYRLRAKVTIEPAEQSVFAVFPRDGEMALVDPESLTATLAREGYAAFADPRLPMLGVRALGNSGLASRLVGLGSAECAEGDHARYRRALGVAEGAELGVEKLFLLEANFEELHGVDFKKGCYVGQELTARMKHKTELKKRLLPFAVDGAIEAGTPLTCDGRELGSSVHGGTGIVFAVTRLDRLAEADRGTLRLGDHPARLLAPSWLAGTLLES